jgi:src kinase associated phosphoprotein 1
MDRDEDFENLFYGKWDCVKNSSKELSFKRGDLIHVLSMDFDGESWWVGELDGHVGLVPKDFLCPAYTLVA